MIFIFFQGFKKAPFSMFLFFTYCFLFFYNYNDTQNIHKKSSNIFFEEHFMDMHSKVYSQFIGQNPESYSLKVRSVASKAMFSDTDSQISLIKMSLKDKFFLKKNQNFSYKDKTGYNLWYQKQKEFMEVRASSVLVRWGLSSEHHDWMRRFSYQFLHMGFLHFFVNMFFLLLFAPFVEKIMGPLFFLSFFVLSGAFSSYFYDFFNEGLSLAPLIGASGSLSALLAFLCVYYGMRPVPYFWFVFPKKNYMGFIYLPAILGLVLWMIGDLAGLLNTGQNSIAYSAHLGGEVFGIMIGLVVCFFRKSIYEEGFKKRPLGFVES